MWSPAPVLFGSLRYFGAHLGHQALDCPGSISFRFSYPAPGFREIAPRPCAAGCEGRLSSFEPEERIQATRRTEGSRARDVLSKKYCNLLGERKVYRDRCF